MNKKTLIIVDDHKILHHSISQTLKTEKEFRVVAQADTGKKAVELARRHTPDLMIMDISLPDFNGMEATRRILSENPAVRIVALTMHAEKVYVKGMLKAGATGYVIKSSAYSVLIKALKTVSAGGTFLSPEITHLLVGGSGRTETRDAGLSQLTPRELQVLQYIAEGLTSREMALKMDISSKTIDLHRNNLKKKLNIRTIAGLTKLAVAKGLTFARY